MKILVATGGSKHSEDAVQTGIALAQMIRSPVTILTVIKDPEMRAEAQAIVDQSVAIARQVFEKFNQRYSGVPIETRIRLGHPAEEIVTEAREGNYTLIVVGTWPKLNLLHSLLAPATERIVMQAPCPVLVAKGKIRPLQRVLLCVSGAQTPSKAASFLTELSKEMTSYLDVTVLHVMSQISVSPEIPQGWQLEATAEKLIEEDTPEGQWLRQEIEVLKEARVRIHPKVRHGLVVDEVLMEALCDDCDLLVIGAHREAGWQRYLLDDLTHQIVVRSERPVLVV